jgi:hypothetical protein
MTRFARLRRLIPVRGELFPEISADELRRLYWEHRGLAEAAAFDGYFATSRSHHDTAARYLRALKRRGEFTLPASTPEVRPPGQLGLDDAGQLP